MFEAYPSTLFVALVTLLTCLPIIIGVGCHLYDRSVLAHNKKELEYSWYLCKVFVGVGIVPTMVLWSFFGADIYEWKYQLSAEQKAKWYVQEEMDYYIGRSDINYVDGFGEMSATERLYIRKAMLEHRPEFIWVGNTEEHKNRSSGAWIKDMSQVGDNPDLAALKKSVEEAEASRANKIKKPEQKTGE